MNAPRRICVVTGSRAEYGLLYWTLRGIAEDPALALQLVVTGTHLSPAYGLTYQQIEADGFAIAAKVDMALTDDSELAIGRAMGRAVSGFAEALHQLQPDLLMVLGDRYEILAAAQAAMLQRIPIAHIHGGESTEGLIDEAVRHALTKMSHIHCVAAEAYACRVIQMGERPHTVHVVGAAGFDQLSRTQLLGREALEQAIDCQLGQQNFLVTLHPETLDDASPAQQVQPLLEALAAFPEARVIVTGSNADPAGRKISELLKRHAEANPARYCYRESLGQQRYLSLLQQVDVVIGNSSSGIIEVPAVGKPVVNIGERQRSRLRAPAIIDCPSQSDAIRAAINQALTPEHQALAAKKQTPYGEPGAAEKIVRVLRDTPLDGILQKRFYDVPVEIRA
ncbi:UDP-N-acetyl glucosamine 2-epimerase [Candidatus Tenderia electrophaga]|jgi:UDP-hydrolysing UDP-N-acetyl-D-glucosamine 2-epimerase|uniref:UDP-N-acetyl glucosamine 2-epimerase n=1 Tax=Candidatus Tenderia electrophaga TaxID=1748243 RepID=A0A0S2TBW8_9GAMM|nr:UDP-N-acetyl glucosamine 2-epimerase [Candidatus Tenderia electrophaga]